MFKKSSIKRLTIVLAALLVMMVMVLTACTTATPFKQRKLPAKADPIGNGGVAVLYGEWLYYLNGSISSPDEANNAYTEELRSGSVVRIKLTDLEEQIFSVAKLGMSSNEKSKEVSKRIRKYAEMVVPNVYYNGNSDADLNGIYIFDERIYITTPNDDLDSKGNVLSNQLVLSSYNLGGGQRQNHLVFESNNPQLKLAKSTLDGKLYATYVLDGKLMSYKVGDKKPVTVAEETTDQRFSGEYVHYLDKDGSICRFQIGAAKATELVHLEQPDDHDHLSYSIQKVNGEYVYYTVSGSPMGELDPGANGKTLYYTNEPVDLENGNHTAILNTVPSGTYFCYGDKVIYAFSDDGAPSTGYRLVTISGNGEIDEDDGFRIAASINLVKLEDNVLYYTASNVTYTITLDTSADDLGIKSTTKPVAYMYGSIASSGSFAPDVLQVGEGAEAVTYVFTVSVDAINIVKFDPETKKNVTNTSFNITLVSASSNED